MTGRRALASAAARQAAEARTGPPEFCGPRTGVVWQDVYADPDRWSRAHPDAAMLTGWITGYLAEPHPDLGRDGPVCPFVRQATLRRALWMAVLPGGDDLTVDDLSASILDARDLYQRLRDGRDERWLTTVTAFPGLTDTGRVDHAHRLHKTEVVCDGLMLGQFYPGCRVPGLWNIDFHPLDAPLPMLVIRPMMTTDFPFLVAHTEWLYAYFGKVAPQLPRALRWSIAERMRVSEEEAGRITALRVHDRDEHAT
ncbi:DUF6875 domain-containing protein [Nocardia sp. NPDC024068]|uniref:DUF6875 domain-containing protein n=1 Tax=Nocardia sp. NPDC024068 TaxID=3157197 RepID=UPI00340F05E2